MKKIIYHLTYSFRLISKDNFKSFNRAGRFFLSSKFKAWEEKVKWETIKKYKKPPLEGNLKVYIIAGFKDRRHTDCSNLPKGLLDSLQGIVYKNDRQIKHLECVVLENEPQDGFTVAIEQI